jgi:ribosomal protein S27E
MDYTHLTTGRVAARLSGGFTLDEAARLYRHSAAGMSMPCPGCGNVMSEVVGRRPSGGVSLLRCPSCGRGLVLDRAPPTTQR